MTTIIGQDTLVVFKLCQANITRMVIGQKHFPVFTLTPADMDLSRQRIVLALTSTMAVDASIARVGQQRIDGLVARHLPAQLRIASALMSQVRQLQLRLGQVMQHRTDRAQLAKQLKDMTDGMAHALVSTEAHALCATIIL